MRQIRAAFVRVGMRVAREQCNEMTGIVRPHPDTLKRGYGRIWIQFGIAGEVSYYPSDWITLAADCDDPLDLCLVPHLGKWGLEPKEREKP